MAKGRLIVNTYVDNIANPVEKADVEIEGMHYKTNINGQTDIIDLNAPDEVYSEEPQHITRPYTTYDIRVTKLGLVPAVIKGVEIYPDVTSTQDVYLTSIDNTDESETVVEIDDPTLWGDYAPKLPEEEATPSISPKVLPIVIIPSYVIIHDGIPTNTSAANYQVSFVDYIKNVACSEVYATWPYETIKANVAAIVSFALNRIYTEWYRSKGYNFTITGVTSYDQKYTNGRTIFDTISKVVDQHFNQYIKFPNRNEPYLAQYKATTSENNQLSQWGSKDLGDRGYTSEQILKHYYGNTLTIQSAPISEDYPTSFPGYNLKLNDCGEEVQKLQNELNKIRGSYPGIPVISNPNGVYNSQTLEAVKMFQKVFSLPQTGIVDYATWYKISYVYVAVTKMLEAKY